MLLDQERTLTRRSGFPGPGWAHAEAGAVFSVLASSTLAHLTSVLPAPVPSPIFRAPLGTGPGLSPVQTRILGQGLGWRGGFTCWGMALPSPAGAVGSFSDDLPGRKHLLASKEQNMEVISFQAGRNSIERQEQLPTSRTSPSPSLAESVLSSAGARQRPRRLMAGSPLFFSFDSHWETTDWEPSLCAFSKTSP